MSGNLDATFLTTLRDLLQEPTKHAISEGREIILAPNHWKQIEPARPAAPAPLEITTLTGVRDYVAGNIDDLQLDDVMLHVVGPTRVDLVDSLEDEETMFRRPCYLRAEASPPKFNFGEYGDAEQFMVALQTKFMDTPGRQRLLELMASIRDEDVLETVDDGVAQQVNTARGVRVAREKVPNPVLLRPYRTFAEIEQPESAFVVRMRPREGDRPQMALFEADGGAWKLVAITAIAEWLRVNVHPVVVIG